MSAMRFVVKGEKGQRVLLLRCTNTACGEVVVASLDADRAKCKACGHEWAWGKSGLKMARRGGEK